MTHEMPDNHIIPVSSGLFEHRSRVGPAIWEFLWCIDAVSTEEVDEAGVHWGLVHGGAPVKHERIAREIESSKVTVQRNLAILKSHGYINSVRTARGEIIKVAKNKKDFHKKSDIKNDSSLQSDTSNLIVHSERVIKNDSSDESELSKMTTLKDLKDLDLISAAAEDINILEFREKIRIVENHFVKKRGLGVILSPEDSTAICDTVSDGIPVETITATIDYCFRKYKAKHKHDLIRNFTYCVPSIYDAWVREKAITEPVLPDPVANGCPITENVPSEPVALGTSRNSKTYKAFDMLDQIAREEQEREQNGSHPVAQEDQG
jgi:hypothetical protein